MSDIYTFAYVSRAKIERRPQRTALLDTCFAQDCVSAFLNNAKGSGSLRPAPPRVLE
jgi:hypothetical protein